jgi:hypothetical protein
MLIDTAKVDWQEATTRSLKLRNDFTSYFFPKSWLLVCSRIVVLCPGSLLIGAEVRVG